MCHECEELREEVAWLKGELGLIEDKSLISIIRDRHRLSPKEARVLIALADAKGRALPKWHLMDLIEAPEDDTNRMVIVFVCRIRRKLGKSAIETAWGDGFLIGNRGAEIVSECRQILRQRQLPRQVAA